MTDHRSREQRVHDARQRAVEICAGIIGGTVPVLEGCHSLAPLRWEVEVGEWDEDFVTFAAVSSETDALPVGDARKHWALDALARLEPEIQSASEWALRQALPACKSVMQRFGA